MSFLGGPKVGGWGGGEVDEVDGVGLRGVGGS